MTTYALRKTVGAYSAGTRVNIISDNVDVLTVETVFGEHNLFHVDPDDIVALRNRTDAVPSTSRKKRREFLKGLFSGSKDA